MIKVLHVSKELNSGGIESVICNLYQNINRNTIQFDFIIHTEKKGLHEDEVLAFGAKIFRFKNLVDSGGIQKYQMQWDKFFSEAGREYAIVHLHYMSHEGMIAKVAKKYGKNVIAHSHSTNGPSRFNVKEMLVKCLNRNLSRKADVLLACSKQAGIDFFGKEFEKRGIVLKNAINIEKYLFNQDKREQMRRKYHLEDKFVVGHVGNYVMPKNQDFMLSVFSETVKKNQNAVLVWCGYINEKDQAHLNMLIRSFHIEGHVVLIGRCDNVEEWMQAFDVFLFPSTYEGLGIVLIEAQACGLPCVISETIPKEAEISNLVHRCMLMDAPRQWATELLNVCADRKRCQMKDIIKGEGYDIRETSKYITKLYEKLGSDRKEN